MNFAAIKHIPKSPMAYPIDEDTLHIYLQTAKNDVNKVQLIIGDPSDYQKVNDQYFWAPRTKPLEEMEITYSNEFLDYWFIEVKAQNKRSKYAFILTNDQETYFYGSHNLAKVNLSTDENIIYSLQDYFNFPYINEEDLIDSPAWASDMIWYQIFPELFNRSKESTGNYLPWGSIETNVKNNHLFGGDIKGIIEQIPYLQKLGITGIYFTPIFEAFAAHKYDTIDYFKIDPQFGTNEDFKELVNKCHQVGIKVMLDAVFNHCGWFHPFFQDVIKNKKNSKYWDCFYIEDEDFINFELGEKGEPIHNPNLRPKFRTFGFTPMMPKLKTSHPIIEEYLLNVAQYWVQEYDIDGWRLDVSNEVSHSFWRKFKQVVRSIKPDIYILGENWDDSNAWLKNDQFDAVMNYELSFPIWKFFGTEEKNKIDSVQFSYLINDLIVRYPKNVAKSMFNLVGSHDTMRIITRCGGNIKLAKLAYLFIFTFCGSPAIYYGDEIGLEGKHDPDCRRCMIWDEKKQNKDLLNFFQELIKLRKSYSDFKLVDIKWINNNDNVLVYQKGKLIFIINNNSINKKIYLNRRLKNIVANEINMYNEVNINPYSYFIFEELSENV